MNLRFDYQKASEAGEGRHAEKVMKELGITYDQATPKSILDEYWFWNCKNIPEVLPSYISELKVNPMQAVVRGLSVEDVELYHDYLKR